MQIKLHTKIVIVVALILIADQALKIWVKTHFCLGENIALFGNWGYIYFTENNGMAFGMELWGNVGKFLLTSFRVLFIGVIGLYVVGLVRRGVRSAMIYSLAVMLAGAAGNLLDCLFYGLIFGESSYSAVAQMFPTLGGYAPFMFGKVVDMFYFPVINTMLPEWLPVWGGERLVFFRPIFNIADAAITCSIFYLLIFQRKALSELFRNKQESE
jgi:signal peptidase II